MIPFQLTSGLLASRRDPQAHRDAVHAGRRAGSAGPSLPVVSIAG